MVFSIVSSSTQNKSIPTNKTKFRTNKTRYRTNPVIFKMNYCHKGQSIKVFGKLYQKKLDLSSRALNNCLIWTGVSVNNMHYRVVWQLLIFFLTLFIHYNILHQRVKYGHNWIKFFPYPKISNLPLIKKNWEKEKKFGRKKNWLGKKNNI